MFSPSALKKPCFHIAIVRIFCWNEEVRDNRYDSLKWLTVMAKY